MDPYERLANAIVLQAAKDYRTALRRLNHDPYDYAARMKIKELERFFLSSWYAVLTNVDGELLMERLRKEVQTI